MRYSFLCNQQPVSIETEKCGIGWNVRLPDGSVHALTSPERLDGCIQFHVGEKAELRRLPSARTARGYEISFRGKTYVFSVSSAGKAPNTPYANEVTSGRLVCPMAGIVSDVFVSVGQKVDRYQPVASVEAMKVVATLEAPFKGTVTSVHIKRNDLVAQGSLVIEIEPSGEDE